MSAGDLALALKGFAFIANPRMVVGQMVRRPRSKRYRILKKWANRPENMRYAPMPGLFYMQDARAVIGHPDNIAELKRRLAESIRAGLAQCRAGDPRADALRALAEEFGIKEGG